MCLSLRNKITQKAKGTKPEVKEKFTFDQNLIEVIVQNQTKAKYTSLVLACIHLIAAALNFYGTYKKGCFLCSKSLEAVNS